MAKHIPIVMDEFSLAGQSFCVRPVTVDNFAEMLAIEERAHAHPWRASHLQSSLQQHHCFGVYAGTALCAYAVVALVADEAELLLFVVDIKFQGRGLAKAFLYRLLANLHQSAERVFLEVRASNGKAMAVYEHCGFNQVGVRPGYYPRYVNGRNQAEDAFIYACELLAD